MIRLSFEGCAEEVLADMQALLNANKITLPAEYPRNTETKGEGDEKPAEEKPAPKSRKTPTKETPAASTAEPQSAETKKDTGGETSEDRSAPSASTSPSDFNVEGVDLTDRESVRFYVSQSLDILGGPIVTQVFSEFGATGFKGITPEQYAPLVVRLDELRKSVEAEAAEKGA